MFLKYHPPTQKKKKMFFSKSDRNAVYGEQLVLYNLPWAFTGCVFQSALKKK